jgi:serine/threonine-protein kinase
VPFDLDRLEIAGTAVPIVDGVQVQSVIGNAAYGFSDDGMLVYLRGGDTSQIQANTRSLVWVDRDGREERLAAEPRGYLNPRLSPDSQRLAVTIQGNDQDVFILDLVRGTSSRLTFDPANDQRPVWTPDGQQVVFYSPRAEGGIYRRAANGTGQAERLTTSQGQQQPEFFSSEETLVFRDANRGQAFGWDLRTLSLGGEPASQSLLETDYMEGFSALSPDGRWIAYVSNETGETEVYVRPFPDVDDGKWQISTNGGGEPLWGPDGRELFYLIGNNPGEDEVYVVSVTADPVFSPGAPELLFRGEYGFGGSPNWDISSDGQRFLMMKVEEQAEQESGETALIVVNNWFEELNRLAPAAE